MAFRRGFKAEANGLAGDVRAELGLGLRPQRFHGRVRAEPSARDRHQLRQLAALDVVMAEQRYHRIAGGDMSKAREKSPSPEPPTDLGNPEVEL